MNTHLDYELPDEKFWEDYALLWENSTYRPVFQSPHFIRYLAEKFREGFAYYHCYRDGGLIGAVFFKKTKGIYHFLTDIKSDYSLFTLCSSCSHDEIAAFFRGMFDAFKKENWAVILRRQPEVAAYMDDLLFAGKQSGLFLITSICSVCPVLEGDSADAVFKMVNRARVRQKENKLRKTEGMQFEAIAGDSGLGPWTKTYTESHIQRWQGTITPSVYLDPGKEDFLFGCLKAWADDQLLVRLSLKTDQKMIAQKVALRHHDSLISHSHTFDPAYKQYSPGKALLRHTGKWMKSQQLSKLDFGCGDEKYKYHYANKEYELRRVYISRQANLPFICFAYLMKAAKSMRYYPTVYNFYRRNTKPVFWRLYLRVGALLTIALNGIKYLAGALPSRSGSETKPLLSF